MRIDELTRPEYMHRARDLLASKGYKQLGSGSHGIVVQKEGRPYVVKLFHSDDDCYLRFLDVIRNNKNPHFPKVFGKPTKVTEHYYAVRLEPLTPLPHPAPKEALQILRLAGMFYRHEEGQVHRKPNLDNPVYQTALRTYPQLMDALTLIKGVKQPSGKKYCIPDFYDRNMMLRGNFPVFIDPMF